MTAGDTRRALTERGGSMSLACWDGTLGAVIAAALAITPAAGARTMKSCEVLTASRVRVALRVTRVGLPTFPFDAGAIVVPEP